MHQKERNDHMYTPEQQALLEKVEGLKREKKLSQNEVGKLMCISGAALSQIKSPVTNYGSQLPENCQTEWY